MNDTAIKKRYFVQTSGSSFWIPLVSSLSDSFDLRLALVDDRIADGLQSRMPSVRVLRANDLKHGLFRRDQCIPLPVKNRTSEQFARRFSQALYSFERLSVGGTIDFPERSAILTSLADFLWSQFLCAEPSFGIMTESPHTLSDLLLTGIAESEGVPILHFQQNGFLPSVRPVLGAEYRPVDLVTSLTDNENLIRCEQFEQFRPQFEEFVKGAQAASMAQFERAVHDLDQSVFSGWKAPWRRFYVPYSWLDEERKQVREAVARDEVDPQEANTSAHGLTGAENFTQIARRSVALALRQARQLRQLRVMLEDVARPLPSEPYALMFLSFEPEKTSIPDGGAFGDQIFAVRSVANAIGGECPLVLKEHPSQLTLVKRGFRVRRRRFYEELCSIPNVQFAPRDVSRPQMFQNARVVMTLTGTVGLEAWCQGLPVVLLGNTWYRDLEGIFSVSDYLDLADGVRSALASVRKPNEQAEAILWNHIVSSSLINVLNPYFDKVHGSVDDDLGSLSSLVRNLFQ